MTIDVHLYITCDVMSGIPQGYVLGPHCFT